MPAIVRQRVYEQKHLKNGLCRTCPAKATHGVYCAKHHRKVLKAQRRRLKAKKRAAFGKLT